MPELPEVQTVINHLNKTIQNQKILNLLVYAPNVLQNCTPEQFKNFMIGETIRFLSRRGKYLLIHLTNNKIWLVHLRMEGKLFAVEKNNQEQFANLVAEFSLTNFRMVFLDSRHFGTFHILYEDEQETFPALQKVTIDPLDGKFTPEFLAQKLHNSRTKIKVLLLDQSIVSGIGNIYADEILFASGIHPERMGKDINPEEIEKIVANAKAILADSIKHHGTTIHSFAFAENESGGYQNFLKIHRRDIKKCPNCQHSVKFDRVGGRGTYYCPVCQEREKDDRKD